MWVRSYVYEPELNHNQVRSIPYTFPDFHRTVRFSPYCDRTDEGMNPWFMIRDGGFADPVERDWTQIRFMYNNLWDTGTLTASSNWVNFPADKTQHRWHTWCWKSEEGGEQWLKVDLGSAQDIRAFVLENHWFLPSMDKIHIQANATDVWTSPSIDVELEVTYPGNQLVKFWETAQTYRWWRLALDGDESNIAFQGDTDNCPYCHMCFKVGRIFLGEYWTPSVNFKDDEVLALIEQTEKLVSLDGQMSPRHRPIYKKVKFNFDFLTDSDVETFEEIFDSRGVGKELWVCENEKYWWRQTHYCVFASELDIKRVGLNHHTFDVTIETMN